MRAGPHHASSAASPHAGRPACARQKPRPVTPDPAPLLPPDCLESTERLRTALGLTYADLARALVTGESTVHRWRSGASTPRGANRARLAALEEFVAALERCFPTPRSAREWLDAPFAPLGGRSPRMLLVAGRAEALVGALAVLSTYASPATASRIPGLAPTSPSGDAQRMDREATLA